MTTTLVDLFNNQVAANGDAPALRYRDGDDWATITWKQYGEKVHATALALEARGVRAGDSVAIISGPRPEFFVTEIASNALGAKSASIYQTNSAEQVLYVLDNSDAQTIFVENADQAAKIAKIRDEVPGLLVVSYADDSGDVSFADLLAEGTELVAAQPGRYDELAKTVDAQSAACIIYTSGTTGLPKAALINHESVMTVLDAIDKEWSFPGSEFRVLAYLPLAHIAERAMSMYSQLKVGGEVWFGDITNLTPDLQAARPTRFLAVPRVWEKLEEALRAKVPTAAGLPEENKLAIRAMLGLDKIDVAISGAAPISPETLQYFTDLGVELVEVFGMTETTGLATANPLGAQKIGTVGKPVFGIEVKIADDGEILIKGANFSGYLKNPEATAEALDEDGWMHSGDLGSIDEEGYISITGRKKDLIITAGGENISPSLIQMLLGRSPYISQAVVIGDKRRFISALITLSEEAIRPWAVENGLGELSMAELSQNDQVRALIEQAVADANDSLARVQQVRKFEILPSDFSIEADELTPTLKLKRNVIENHYGEVIESIYA